MEWLLLTTGGATVDKAALEGITKTLMDNVAMITPWGLGILAIFIGLYQLPKLIKMFTRG